METAGALHSKLRNPRKSFNNSILLLKPGREKNEKQLTWETELVFCLFALFCFFGEETVVLETIYHMCLLVLHPNSIRENKKQNKT